MPEGEGARPAHWVDRRFTDKALRPRYAAYVIGGFWLFAVLGCGVIERIADPDTFDTIWLAFWWAIQTVTTVGYGDVVPGDPSGKALASILMLGGLSLISVVTATITSAFVARRQAARQEAGEDPVMRQLSTISARLDSMETELRRLSGTIPPDG